MSRQTIRSSVAAYLNEGIAQPNPAIPYLSQIFAHAPKLTQNGEFFTNVEPGAGVGAIMYIWLHTPKDERIATQGEHGGRKVRYYPIDLVNFLRNSGLEDPDAEEDMAQVAEEANDAFLDGVEAWIRADRTAGTAADSTGPYAGTGYVFQWGEGDTKGSVDLATDADLPRQMKRGLVQCFSIIHVTALEILDT